MVKIKKIGVLSFGKIYGIISAIMGLILGAFLTLFSLIGAVFTSEVGGIESMLFGVGAIIILPIFYGAIGFIIGIITALIYNLAAKLVGGLEVETEK